MTSIQSIAVTFKSTIDNTPQANFSNESFACISVTCTAGPSGQCTSALATQSFTLKTTAAIGDPADGGVIACMDGGLNNLIASKVDNATNEPWGSNTVDVPNANSGNNGFTNTEAIITALGANPSAAKICTTYSGAGVIHLIGFYLL